MKKLTKYNRVAGFLNSIYDKLNQDFFNNEMERPVITIQSSPKVYGHFTLYDAWSVNDNGVREINIGAGTLARPIENVVSTLVHEMCHQWNNMKGIKDVSRGAMYHNKHFKESAQAHGLIVSRSEIYGWTITEPSDELIEWILINDLTDIPMNRNEFSLDFFGGQPDTNKKPIVKPTGKGSYKKYRCSGCKLLARTTKDARLVCGDCEIEMEREG